MLKGGKGLEAAATKINGFLFCNKCLRNVFTASPASTVAAGLLHTVIIEVRCWRKNSWTMIPIGKGTLMTKVVRNRFNKFCF